MIGTSEKKVEFHARNLYSTPEEAKAYVEGAKYVKSENFGFGCVVGFFFTLLLVVGWGTIVVLSDPESAMPADYKLNSPKWRIDTVTTIVRGDTTTTFHLVKNEEPKK